MTDFSGRVITVHTALLVARPNVPLAGACQQKMVVASQRDVGSRFGGLSSKFSP